MHRKGEILNKITVIWLIMFIIAISIFVYAGSKSKLNNITVDDTTTSSDNNLYASISYNYYNGSFDTNASTACSGTTTYLDGEGNCDDISTVYYLKSNPYNFDNNSNVNAETCTSGNYSRYNGTGFDCYPDLQSGSDVNKSYVDAQDSAQDECSEITGCVENAITSYKNLSESNVQTYLNADTCTAGNYSRYNGTGFDCYPDLNTGGGSGGGTFDYWTLVTEGNTTTQNIINATVINITSSDGNITITHTSGHIIFALASSWFSKFATVINVNNWIATNSTADRTFTTTANSSMKTYVDTQDSAQDECSEITGCVENAITSYKNLTEDNVEAYIFDTDNTADLGMGNYDIDNIKELTFNTNVTHHRIYTNATTIIIRGKNSMIRLW